MKNKTIKSLAGIVAGATALAGLLGGCAGSEVQSYEWPRQSNYQKPVNLPEPQIIKRINDVAKRETPEQKVKREAMEYVQRNRINLSVLEKGEEVTGMYFMGESDRSRVVFTNYAAPIVKELDGLFNKLERTRTGNWNKLQRLRAKVFNANARKGYVDFSHREFDEAGKEMNEDWNNSARDIEGVIQYLDRGCDNKGCVGKTDHLIIGREAKKAERYLRNYLESTIQRENQKYVAKSREIERSRK